MGLKLVKSPLGLFDGHFFSRFAEFIHKRESNAASPIIMFHEVATLVHLIESSKPEAHAEGIRLIVLYRGTLTPRGATVPRDCSYR